MPPDPPALAAEITEIAAGLGAAQAAISPKYFYDAEGSVLFERITRLPEYYLTRTERAIMQAHGEEIGRQVGRGATVIELGAGNCEKARHLCALLEPRCFVAVDISADFLHRAVAGLRAAFPALDVRPVVADLLDELALPEDIPTGRRLVFYPGSSIGNFDPPAALALLRRMRSLLAADGALLIGVDLVKDPAVLVLRIPPGSSRPSSSNAGSATSSHFTPLSGCCTTRTTTPSARSIRGRSAGC